MVALRTTPGLAEGLEGVANALESLSLETAGIVEPGARTTRDRLVRTIRGYLIPRLLDPSMPLCVVLAGPTGSGKSTLANSLSGIDFSETGPIRPTTTGPVVLASSRASEKFSVIGGVACEVVTGSATILDEIALVDTPDIDSTSVEHRRISEALIDSADVVLFITSPLRYADEVPWSVLRRATERGAPVLHVLNRLDPGSAGALVDLKGRIRAEGLESEVLRVATHHLPEKAQSVPALAVKAIADRLIDLAVDRERRQREIFSRVVSSTVDRAYELADSVERGMGWFESVAGDISSAYSEAAASLDLQGSGAGLALPKPPRPGNRRANRWIRRHGMETVELRQYLRQKRRSLTATIEDNLGSLITAPERVTSEATVIRAPLDSLALRRGIQAVIGGWFDFVVRMASALPEPGRPLATAMIVESALGGETTEAHEWLLGDKQEEMVSRARRELESRIESLYEAAARRGVTQLDALAEQPYGATRLRRSLAAVGRSQFTNA